jgi:fused signal recognition particle receptor
MSRRLLGLNVLFVAVSVLVGAYIVRQLITTPDRPAAERPRPAATAATPAPTPTPDPAAPRAPGSVYTIVASRNLFSPTRTETPPVATTTPAAAAVPAVKPSLQGVVLRDGAPVAYLEDPTTKRVAGYRVGDSIIGGTVQTISDDHVIIARPDGRVDVRLRDPSKPRPAVQQQPAPGAITAGQQQPVQPPLPGVIPPAGPAAVPPAAPRIQQQPSPIFPGRRPLPPNVLRRIPPVPPRDASQQ